MKGLNDSVHRKRYILVVDANSIDRFSASMLLQRFGYNIFTASTAEEAIELMKMAPPAAVVAEAGLLLAGSSLFSIIKKDSRISNIPLILLVPPNATLEDYGLQKEEFAACLAKPLSAEEFYRAVQSVIEKGPRRNIRIATHLMATLEDELGGGEGPITVLSEEGMFLRSFEPRPTNTHIPVSFEISGRTIVLEAVVLYCTTADEGPFKEPGMGMRFEKISPVDRDLIKTFILERVKEGVSQQKSYNC